MQPEICHLGFINQFSKKVIYCRVASTSPSCIEANAPPTLDYLINEQDGIGEQRGKFSKILKRAGWNIRAEWAKKIASIN